ncbi:MAG: LytR C-terminal domain-containing protein [Candidatus Marinimicrobia bacterium]|nr:LytR C-terminal domain-containing protein [Candidatus Neomarinimicrobiota bacterium]
MKEKFRGNESLLVLLVTILLFGTAIVYNQLRVNSILTAKKVFPEGIPELTEHNSSQSNLTFETVKLNQELAMVLGARDEKNIANIRIKILNGTQVPGLAAAAKEFFTEAGFGSITIGDTSESTYSATLVKFQPEMQEWAEFIRYLISENLEVELSEIEKEASPEADFNFDIVITLATSSALFEPSLVNSN